MSQLIPICNTSTIPTPVPLPSGTGLLSVTGGAYDSPATLSDRVAADASNLRTQLGLGGSATLNVGTATGTVAAGDDSRLTDSRTPTAHAASHGSTGSDPVSISYTQVSGLGTLATQSGTFSGTSSGTNTGDQDLSGKQNVISFGTGVETALGVNVGTAGAPVINGGALGTPSSGNLANCTFPTLNQSTSGNAATATALQTARNINGVSFNGTADITVTAAASTLSGSTLASGVTASSLTSVGSLTSLIDAGQLVLSGRADATIAADQNDWAPTGATTATHIFTDGGASGRNITGLAGGVAGRILGITNKGTTNAIVLKNGSVSSTAANRFLFPGGDVTLQINASIELRYDGTASVWRPWGRALSNTGVTAGSYGSGSLVPVITVDIQGRVTALSTAAVVGGSTNIFIGAAEFIPRTTTGCSINSLEASTNKQNTDVLEFDASTNWYANVIRILPNNWSAGTIAAKFIWTAASGSGAVVWGLQARAYADGDSIDQASGTAQEVTDTLITATNNHISAATSAITIGGSPANGQPIIFQLYRNAARGSDTLAVNAQLLGVEISY